MLSTPSHLETSSARKPRPLSPATTASIRRLVSGISLVARSQAAALLEACSTAGQGHLQDGACSVRGCRERALGPQRPHGSKGSEQSHLTLPLTPLHRWMPPGPEQALPQAGGQACGQSCSFCLCPRFPVRPGEVHEAVISKPNFGLLKRATKTAQLVFT